MSPEDVSDASDVPSETTARIIRRLADIDAACFPLASDRGVAALAASARLRRAVKIVVSYDDRPSRNPAAAENGDAECADADPTLPVAFVAYSPGSAAFSIARVASDPNRRREGHATAALRIVEAEARARRASRVSLRVESTSASGRVAAALYRKLGYVVDAANPTTKDFYGPGRHAANMILELRTNFECDERTSSAKFERRTSSDERGATRAKR
jgi:ribosomal protein S18 acetylase RimI-like enzyme